MLTDDGEGVRIPLHHPACQVAACFERASVYVVIKESDINALNIDAGEKQMMVERDSLTDFNAFKLILYLCPRHDYDLRYLLEENELEITKRRHLMVKETQ
ncbi:MAG TPA: hypothetical protein VFQ47_07225 [Nitrososphaera sp.]|jgi:hypothetical protein|nr:hypothetical protein [Nitrososphaera sp.]